jgi:transcriptional regulator with XRE-family HTH domain
MPYRKKKPGEIVISQGYVPHPTRIGQLLGEILSKTGWTYRELASELGIHFTTVGKLLNGRRITENLDVLRKLSELSGKPIEVLFEMAYMDKKEAVSYVFDRHRRAQAKEKKA